MRLIETNALNVRLLLVVLWTTSTSWVGNAGAQRPHSAQPPNADHSAQPIAVGAAAEQLKRLWADLEFLSSDELRGRAVGDPSIDVAADYIADRMSQVGLDTTAFSGTPFQSFNVSLGARPGAAKRNKILVRHRSDQFPPFNASLGEGMNPMAIGSGSGVVSGRVVFAGYGITAPKLGYDDYAGIDASGATVIVLRKEPGANDRNSPFAGTRNTRHAYFSTKIDNAIQHGAAAMLLVNDPFSVLQGIQNQKSKITQEEQRRKAIEQQLEELPEGAVNIRQTLRQKLDGIDSVVASLGEDLQQAERGLIGIAEAGERAAGTDSIPVVSIARDLVDRLFVASQQKTLEEVEAAIDQTTTPHSFALPQVDLTVSVELMPTLAETSNVVGVLAGKGALAGETVVVGAHYDHVGMGGYGSLAPGTIAVHNGADDNASGTAALLAIASNVVRGAARKASHRTVVFIAFTGEERGLLGSRHYVRNPRFPLNSTVTMVNLDMVGRLRDNELTVYGVGSADQLDAIVETANERQRFDLFKVATGFGPSDHQSFYEAGIPVLFFFTGLHNDYHRPSDDFDKIDFGGLTRITDIVSEVTSELAVRPQRPKYAETENRFQMRHQMTAFMGVTLSDRGDHVVLSGLAPDGPAQRAGLQVGDRLNSIAKTGIRSSSDVLEVIRRHAPGDRLPVQITRNGTVVDLIVQLESRPEG